MLVDVGFFAAPFKMEAPAIYMTRAAAKHHQNDDERIVRVRIEEIR